MPLRAGAAEVEIKPPLPIEKVGWFVRVVAQSIADPIFAKALVLESADGTRVGFVALDLLSVRWTLVKQIRAIGLRYGIPETNLMVSATHNHAAPAAVTLGEVRRNDAFVELLLQRIEQAITEAVRSLRPAQLGIESEVEGRVSFIRRAILKDGSAGCHAALSPEVRCLEGVLDPELGILCVKDAADGRVLAVLVNFACHPTHHGPDAVISAGWPGRLYEHVNRALGAPCITLLLNGAFGDVHFRDIFRPEYPGDMDHIGETLADDVARALPKMQFADRLELRTATTTVELPYRDIDGPYGANAPRQRRHASDAMTEVMIEHLREKKGKRDHTLAHVQAFRIGPDAAFVAMPGELFTELGLRIKTDSPFARTYVVGAANGMVGYVPTREAFERGGYETTLAMSSKLAPEAAQLLLAAAARLLRALSDAE